MNKHIQHFFILLGLLSLAGCSSQEIQLTVANPTGLDRNEEIVEVALTDLNELPDQFIVVDAENKQLPYQVTYDGKLIFPVTIAAKSSAIYTIKSGKADCFPTIACGRVYPERADDVAWENDKVAFRAYGPALQRNNERAFGYDVFAKRGTKEPVVESWYALELNKEYRNQIQSLRKEGNKEKADSLSRAISYHIDHGTGMDDYSVGATLGGGTSALLNEDKIVYPWAYKTCEILDNGPLRYTMRLEYNPFSLNADENNITETRLVSLDAGSQLNKAQVTYKNLSNPTQAVAGIVIHPNNPDGFVYNKEDGYIAYADLTDHLDRNQGTIYVGAAFPNPLADAKIQLFTEEEKDEHKGALGHVLGISNYEPESTLAYYFGSGWSKAGMQSMEAWINYLKDFVLKANNPLQVTINK